MNINQKVNIPIITYHSIDKSGSVISTEPNVFRKQMKFLSEMNYEVISLERFLSKLTQNCSFATKTAVLTFDDGFQNFLRRAFPVLDEFGFNATVFLITDFCGKHNTWKGNLPNLPKSKLLDWGAIKELSKYGIDFGVHTKTHPDLTKLSVSEIKDEINQSKRTLENKIGKEAKTFAYPYGKYNKIVKQIVKENFQAACSTKLGKVRQGSDLFSLKRVDSYYITNLKVFNNLSTRGFDHYLNIRQALRSFKSFIYQN